MGRMLVALDGPEFLDVFNKLVDGSISLLYLSFQVHRLFFVLVNISSILGAQLFDFSCQIVNSFLCVLLISSVLVAQLLVILLKSLFLFFNLLELISQGHDGLLGLSRIVLYRFSIPCLVSIKVDSVVIGSSHS
jgi:hypothetical protein